MKGYLITAAIVLGVLVFYDKVVKGMLTTTPAA